MSATIGVCRDLFCRDKYGNLIPLRDEDIEDGYIKYLANEYWSNLELHKCNSSPAQPIDEDFTISENTITDFDPYIRKIEKFSSKLYKAVSIYNFLYAMKRYNWVLFKY